MHHDDLGEAQVTPALTGFLGDSYALLTPGAEGQPAMRYLNPDVDWKQYKALMVEPVQFWAGEDPNGTPETQQILTSYFYNRLRKKLAKQFKLTDMPRQGVIRLQSAITDVTTATPVLRTVSLVIPQARILNQAQSLATGSYAFSGTAEGPM